MFFQRSARLSSGAEVRAVQGDLLPDERGAALAASAPSAETTFAVVRRRLTADRPVVETEAEWRRPWCDGDAAGSMRVAASRWQAFDDVRREVRARTADDGHLVKIVLRTTNLSLSIDGKCVHDGVATPGMVHVTKPGAAAHCLFRGPYDTLHLHVPNALIAECLNDMPVRSGIAMPADPGLIHDRATERLGRTMLTAGHDDGSLGPLFADCIGIAIVARLLSGFPEERGAGGVSRAGLVKWRLKRAIDYVEAHLGEPIRLTDLAEAAGLTRMHFAAQFKASTGLRPHEYLLRRRIERAQEMLLVAKLSVVDIALSVGFQTQSHFTAIFARFVGQTPHAWRVAQGAGR